MHVKWRGLELPYAVVKDDRSATPTFGRFTAEPFAFLRNLFLLDRGLARSALRAPLFSE